MANLDDLAGTNKDALVRIGGAIGFLASLVVLCFNLE
jgi:hypothetical protein